MIDLDASAVLLQWATGGLFFLWVTTRRREVGLGYGWLLRITYGLMALMALMIGWRFGWVPGRDLAAAGVVIGTAIGLWQSVRRRRGGVSGHRAVAKARADRVAAMTGLSETDTDTEIGLPQLTRDQDADAVAEFDPRLDLIGPVIGAVGLIFAGLNAGDPAWLSVARMLVGALFMGVVSDAMLLGHWYLVQPGLGRAPLVELVKWTGWLWLPEVLVFLAPQGMVLVWLGDIDDGFNGLFGWFWGACVVTTIALVFVTLAALKEKQYSAVMAATGLLYLAILTGFGMDLVARASLS